MAMTAVLLPKLVLTYSNDRSMEAQRYDVIIIGGSYSGLAAAMALGRAMRKVLIIDSGKPCNQKAPHSHNFLTNDGKTPSDISALAKSQVLQYDTVNFVNDTALDAAKIQNVFEVTCKSGKQYRSLKLIIATGITDVLPVIPGLQECWGKSVIHCPYCHGYEYRGMVTGVLANADEGFEIAALISTWTTKLFLLTNGPSQLTAGQSRTLKKKGIQIIEDRITEVLHNDGNIKFLLFENQTKLSLSALYTRPPFEQHSKIPLSLGCDFTAEGYLKIEHTLKTSVAGVFACGDNASRMRTVANAVSMGTTAGIMVNRELVEDEFEIIK